MDISNEHRLTAVEDLAKDNTRRIQDLEERQDKLDDFASSLKSLATREERVEADVKEMKGDIKTIMGKAGERWDGLVDKTLWAVAAAAIGYMLSHFGL